MKNIYFIIIFFLPRLLIGQSFLSESKQWSILYLGFQYNYSTAILKFKGDSLVNGLVYKKLYQTYDTANPIYEFNALFREDSGRIYFIDKQDGSDKLMFDHNLNVGDTAVLHELQMFEDSSKVVITKIDTGLYVGKLKKRWHLEINGSFTQFNDIWIEDIGSEKGLIYANSTFTCPNFSLLCYANNNEIEYTNPFYSACYLYNKSELSIERYANAQVKIYPNPTKLGNTIQVEADKKMNTISIFDLSGAQIIQMEGLNTFKFNPELYHLRNGIYFIDIRFVDGSKSTKKIIIQ